MGNLQGRPGAQAQGRLILPQQQTIRDIIDAGATAVVCRDEELAARRAKYIPREPNIKSGWLSRYSRIVSGADQGAVMK